MSKVRVSFLEKKGRGRREREVEMIGGKKENYVFKNFFNEVAIFFFPQKVLESLTLSSLLSQLKANDVGFYFWN